MAPIVVNKLIVSHYQHYVNTFPTSWWSVLPNVPYQYVFWQLSSNFLHVHRSPLKLSWSAKICTTVVSCECKSRSSACRRSNAGLLICLYPSLMQSTVFQIFTKVSNITFLPIALYSNRFMMHTKTTLCFRELFFFWFIAYQPRKFCWISCANKQQVENLK